MPLSTVTSAGTGAAMPTTPLAAWTYKDAQAAVVATTLARIAKADYDANEKYLAGDHWQNGETWVGPRGDDATWPTVRDAVRRQFTPVGVIGEILSRVANGLLRREADVVFTPTALPADGTPTAAQQAEADAMLGVVSQWWDRVTLWERSREAVMKARALARGVLRLSIAEGMLDRAEDGTTAFPTDLPTLADAFARLTLTAPDAGAAALVTEAGTGRVAAVVLYEVKTAEGRTEKWAEISTLGPIDGRGAAPGDGEAAERLHIRKLPELARLTDYPALPVDRLGLAEMRAPLLITEAIRRQQASLDFGESMLNRTMETAGFKERYVINAEPQGTWTEEDPGNALRVETFADGVTRYLVPEVRTLGAAITTELVGIVSRTAADEETRATPSVVISEPTDPTFAITANEHRRATMLHEAKQAHVLANGEGSVSGYSRDVARADHETDLAATKPAVEGALRAILEAAIAYALAMTSDAGLRAAGIGRDFLTRYRCGVTCYIDAGPLAPEQRREVREAFAAGLVPRRKALALLGEEDVDAVERELEADVGAKLGRLAKVAEVLDALAKATSVEAGVRLLVASGVLSPEEGRALTVQDTDGVPVDDEPRRGPALEAA